MLAGAAIAMTNVRIGNRAVPAIWPNGAVRGMALCVRVGSLIPMPLTCFRSLAVEFENDPMRRRVAWAWEDLQGASWGHRDASARV